MLQHWVQQKHSVDEGEQVLVDAQRLCEYGGGMLPKRTGGEAVRFAVDMQQPAARVGDIFDGSLHRCTALT